MSSFSSRIYLLTDVVLTPPIFFSTHMSICTLTYPHTHINTQLCKFAYHLMQIINIKYLQNPSFIVSHTACQTSNKQGSEKHRTNIHHVHRRSRQKNLRNLLQEVSKTAHIKNYPRSYEKTPKRPRRTRCLTTKSTSPKEKPLFFTNIKNSSAKTPPA